MFPAKLSYLVAVFLCANLLNAEPAVKIGLTLSGGGAKGFAHVGVLKVLEQEGVPIDYITGTSIGAIIGGLYAMGYSAGQLEEIINTTNWERLFSGNVLRRELSMELKRFDGRYMIALPVENRRIKLPHGLISDHRVYNLFSRLTVPVHDIRDFSKLSIPFTCIGTDIITGEAVVLDSGSLAQALRASMSLPSIFSPIEVNDRLVVDGGIVRNFPVSDVREMGADIVIGVDVSAPLKSKDELATFIDVLDQSASFRAAASNEKERKNTDILIRPDVKGFSMASFTNTREIIYRGEQAALQVADQLRALVDSVGKSDYSGNRLPAIPDSFRILEIKIEGLNDLRQSVIRSQLRLDLPGTYTLADLDMAMERIYSIQSFGHSVYTLRKTQSGYRLVVRVTEKSDDLFRLGLRYNSHTNAGLLLNTFFRNLAQKSSYVNLDLKLGSDLEFDGQYFYHTGWLNSIGFSARAHFSRTRISLFDDTERRAEVNLIDNFYEFGIGSIFSTKFVFSVGLRYEETSVTERIATEQDSLRFEETYFPLINTIWWDTLDRRYFPTSGFAFRIRNDFVHKNFLNPVSFSRNYFNFRGYLPVARRFTLNLNAIIAARFGDSLPPNYRFILGGLDMPVMLNTGDNDMVSFYGTKYQELAGQYIQFLQSAIQFELTPLVFLGLSANIGNTFEEWNTNLNLSRYRKGIGLSVGALTPFGPFEVTAMSGTGRGLLTHVDFGFKF